MDPATPQQNLNVRSTTKVTISSHEKSADTVPLETLLHSAENKEDRGLENIISDGAIKHQLEKEKESCQSQIKDFRGTVEHFNSLVNKKQNFIATLKVKKQLLRESISPLEKQFEEIKRNVQLKQGGELEALTKSLSDSEKQADEFRDTLDSYKKDIDSKTSSLASHRERLQSELDSMRLKFKGQVENAEASLKEVQKVHRQVLVEKNKWSDQKRDQTEKVSLLGRELEQLYTQFEKVGVERKAVSKDIKELDAGLKDVEEKVKRESESPTLSKIEDNKKNLATREKHITNLTAEKEQKKKKLSALSGKLENQTEELNDLGEQRSSLEVTFKGKMDELRKTTGENTEAQNELENVKKRTEDFEKEMRMKIAEARKKSACYTESILRQMEGVKRASVSFANQAEYKRRLAQQEREEAKDELRDELKSTEEMLNVLQQGHRLEMESKVRYFSRQEKELESFCAGEKEGVEFEMNQVQENIQKLGVTISREQSQFEQKMKDFQQETSEEKKSLSIVKKVLQAEMKMRVDEQKAVAMEEGLKVAENDLISRKKEYQHLLFEASSLKRKLEKHRLYVPDFNGEEPQRQGQLERPINGAVQVLSNKLTLQIPNTFSNYDTETQHKETNLIFTRVKKVTYTGEGIDHNVLKEAARVLDLKDKGVLEQMGNSEQEKQQLTALAECAHDLQKFMKNLEYMMQNNLGSMSPELRIIKRNLDESIEFSQRRFSNLTQQLPSAIHTMDDYLEEYLQKAEQDLQEDSDRIAELN